MSISRAAGIILVHVSGEYPDVVEAGSGAPGRPCLLTFSVGPCVPGLVLPVLFYIIGNTIYVVAVLAGGARCNSGGSVDTWLRFPAGPPVLGAP